MKNFYSFSFYMRIMATMVVTTSPETTGTKFLLASSNGLTLQMAAAGMSAQGTNVPPPTWLTQKSTTPAGNPPEASCCSSRSASSSRRSS